MPSLASFQLAPPSDAREFEKILRDYCDYKYHGTACLFARPGQKQYGIDVISSGQNGIIAVQCKDYQNTVVTTKMIDGWISSAEEFSPSINCLIIAIADKTDGEIQRYVSEVNQKHQKKGLFSIIVLYWEEISAFLKTNPLLLQQYYPFINTCYFQGDSNIAYRNSNELRMAFVDLVLKYRVQDFLLEDPFVGVKTDYLISADLFDIEMEELLKKAVYLQESDVYKKICHYFNNWNEYRGYLAFKVQPSNDGQFVRMSQMYRDDYQNMEGIVRCLKDELFKVYKSITG